ncbi:MAG: 6-phosphofructokinase [Firmicutes bacterium]|nr:6-phosphofructokinase [Bacillota bacterium]
MQEIKTIGVLTSGGDAPGMNAAIRAVVRTGIYYGLKVMGIRKGYNGLISGDIVEMNLRSVSDMLHRGGTILHTARSAEFKTEAGMKKAVTMSKVFGIDGIVVIGGDGSFRGARDLSELGIPTVALPGTIDNDIACSEYTIGFDTALNTVKDAIDKIRDTATSHQRCSVIEVMGKNAGYIAVNVGIANGAEAIIIPEKEFNFNNDVLKPIIEGKHRGKKHDIVILAEGVGGAVELAQRIQDETGIESRATILGHIQRGGSPTVMDRVIASQMGAKAVQLLKDNIGNRVIAMKDNKIVNYDIVEALEMTKTVDEEILELAKILSL